MYRFQYASIQDEAPVNAKLREKEILQKSIDLLRSAEAPNAPPSASSEAVHYTARVWTAFLDDLAKSDNQLPKEVRASLISIGIWILKQLDAIRSGEVTAYRDVIEITEIIKDGLH